MADREKPLTNRQTLNSVQSMSQMLMFFDKYGIETVTDLSRVVSEMRSDYENVRTELKKNDRRLKTIDEHLRRSENFKVNRKVAARLDKLTADRAALNRRYKTLKSETQKVEQLKREVDRIMTPSVPGRERPKTRERGYKVGR